MKMWILVIYRVLGACVGGRKTFVLVLESISVTGEPIRNLSSAWNGLNGSIGMHLSGI
jgi:prolipoprotein diacylglyceryltransferase